MIDHIVIGGGFSGLLAAREAHLRGETVEVLEKNNDWGGLVSSVLVGGYLVDSGAEAFSVVGSDVLDLITELGLAAEIEYPSLEQPTIMTKQGRSAIPRGVMGIPADLEDLRGVPGFSNRVITQAYERDSVPMPEGVEKLSVADLVTLRLGPELVQNIVDPLCLGVHSCQASEVEAQAVFPELVRETITQNSLVKAVGVVRGTKPSPGSAVATLRGGLYRLIDALVEHLVDQGVRLRRDTLVTSLARREDHWEVSTPSGVVAAREVSLCVGPSVASALLASQEDLTSELSPIATVDQALSIVVVKSAELSEFPLGSGALISKNVGIAAKATTHLNAKWGWWRDRLPKHHHVVRFSFGRDGALPREPFDSLVDEALSSLYGTSKAQIIASKDIIWRAGLVRPALGHSDRVARLHLATQGTGLHLRGSYMSGNGLLGISRTAQGEKHVRTH